MTSRAKLGKAVRVSRLRRLAFREIQISQRLVRFGLDSSLRNVRGGWGGGDILSGITSTEPIKSAPLARGVAHFRK